MIPSDTKTDEFFSFSSVNSRCMNFKVMQSYSSMIPTGTTDYCCNTLTNEIVKDSFGHCILT